MLDDEGQFIMTPYLEGRTSQVGGRGRVCASLNRLFQWDKRLFQWSLRNALPSNTYQPIARWFSYNHSNNNCVG